MMPPKKHGPVKDYGLAFHPHAGTILFCDFKGAIEPEIGKRRPVLIVQPRLPYRDGLCTVVPLSTKPPIHPQPFHVLLSKDYLPQKGEPLESWAKCDLVCSVSLKRLDRIQVGQRQYIAPKVSAEDLLAVRQGVLAALGFPPR
jgi:mRNA interferase MazF